MLVDGDPVASWTDESGNGNSPAQATAANQPTLITNLLNAKPAVRFDGNDALQFPTPANFNIANPTIFVVVRRTSGTTIMGKSTSSFTDGRRRKMSVTAGSGSFSYGSGSDSAKINATATTANWNMFGVSTVAENNHYMFLNGDESNSTSQLDDDNYNSANFFLGASFSVGTESFTGDIAEVIIYDHAIGGSQVIGLQNYIATKYNLKVTAALGGSPRAAVSGRVLLPTVTTRRFDGVDDFVDIGTLGNFASSLNADGLCAFCFKLKTTSTAQKNIFLSSNGAGDTAILIAMNRNSSGGTTANKMGVLIRDDDNDFQNVGTTNAISLADGITHTYVVQRVSRYTWEIWQDGVSLPMTNPTATGDLVIGFANFTTTMKIANTAAVDMSDVAIYQRSLTPAEIAAYQEGTFPSNAFRIFTLINGDALIAIDSSANRINGTISGALMLSPRRLASSGVAP